MDFGRLDDISEVDFSLPEIDHFYFRNNGNNHLELLLGAPGWSEPKWKGSIYPAKAKPSEFAAYYSRQFATIEFNTTYYQVPKPALMEPVSAKAIRLHSATPFFLTFCYGWGC
jgi:hypothetical protein